MKNIVLFAAGILFPVSVLAQQFRSGDNVVIEQPVNEDIYITGGTVTVSAPVHGDVIVAGGTIILNDTISGDVLAAGGKITINGYTGDDIRAAGGEININGTVQGDLVVSGGTLIMDRNSSVHGSALLGAGSAIINSTIDKSLKCRAGSVQFAGVAGKDMDCRGNSLLMNGTVNGKSALSANHIEIGDRAAFYGDVTFWQNKPALDLKTAMKKGDAFYEPGLAPERGKWQFLGFASVFFMLWYLATGFTFILLIQFLFGKTMKRAAEEASVHTVRSAGYGFLFLISVPFAAFILILTFIGLPLGILLMIAYGVVIILATVISSVILANWFNNRNNRSWGVWLISLIGFLIFVILKSITIIPVLGWLLMLFMACMAFGSIIASLWSTRGKKLSGKVIVK